MSARPLNAATLALIEASEGLRTTAYRDAVGVWTIGYGHTTAAGPPVVCSGYTITPDEAKAILARDLERTSAGVGALLDVALNDNQFGALVSFAFNLGVGTLATSTLLRLVNGGAFALAGEQFPKWCHAGGQVLPGLVTRRAAERALWETPV